MSESDDQIFGDGLPEDISLTHTSPGEYSAVSGTSKRAPHELSL